MDRGLYLLFKIDSQLFALPSEIILEIGPVTKRSAVPFKQDIIKWVINLHGRVVPLIDLSSFTGLREATSENFIFICGGAYNICLSVGSIMGFEKGGDVLTGNFPAFIKNIVKIRGMNVNVINWENIFKEIEKSVRGGNDAKEGSDS